MGSPNTTPANSDAGTEVATRTEPRQVVNVPLGQALENMDQAWRMALAFAAADIVPQDLRGKPANTFLVMLYGQRLGLPPEVAISTISVVKGRPRMSGQLLLAKVREHGHVPYIPCVTCGGMPGGQIHKPGADGHRYVADHDEKHCTFTIVRSTGPGSDDVQEHTETFTLDDAVRAGLCKIKDGQVQARSKSGEPLPWENYTKRMLMWRALGFCVDVICPEVKMGFVVEGELDGGLEPQPATVAVAGPALAPVAAKRRVVAERTDQPDPALAEQLQDDAEQDAEHATEQATDMAGEPEFDDAAMAADMAAIEAEHRAEYGDGPQAGFNFGPGGN